MADASKITWPATNPKTAQKHRNETGKIMAWFFITDSAGFRIPLFVLWRISSE